MIKLMNILKNVSTHLLYYGGIHCFLHEHSNIINLFI